MKEYIILKLQIVAKNIFLIVWCQVDCRWSPFRETFIERVSWGLRAHGCK